MTNSNSFHAHASAELVAHKDAQKLPIEEHTLTDNIGKAERTLYLFWGYNFFYNYT